MKWLFVKYEVNFKTLLQFKLAKILVNKYHFQYEILFVDKQLYFFLIVN